MHEGMVYFKSHKQFTMPRPQDACWEEERIRLRKKIQSAQEDSWGHNKISPGESMKSFRQGKVEINVFFHSIYILE